MAGISYQTSPQVFVSAVGTVTCPTVTLLTLQICIQKLNGTWVNTPGCLSQQPAMNTTRTSYTGGGFGATPTSYRAAAFATTNGITLDPAYSPVITAP